MVHDIVIVLQGNPSGQQLHFVGFHLVVPMCAARNLAELAWSVGKMVEFSNQSQQNIVTDLMGHTVLIPVFHTYSTIQAGIASEEGRTVEGG